MVGKDAGSGEEWADPVVAWLIDDLGTGHPMIPHFDEGTIESAEDVADVELRGPDFVKPPTTERD